MAQSKTGGVFNHGGKSTGAKTSEGKARQAAGRQKLYNERRAAGLPCINRAPKPAPRTAPKPLWPSPTAEQRRASAIAALKRKWPDGRRIDFGKSRASQLAKLMAKLMPGDVVVVTKLDRLGRSTRELLELIERIGKAGAAFRSLGDPLFDTAGAQGRLLVTMLAAIAEFERELIKERTGAGRERAMVEGVKFGRPRKLSDYQRAEAIKRRAAGETLATIAKSYGVDISMISRL